MCSVHALPSDPAPRHSRGELSLLDLLSLAQDQATAQTVKMGWWWLLMNATASTPTGSVPWVDHAAAIQAWRRA